MKNRNIWKKEYINYGLILIIVILLCLISLCSSPLYNGFTDVDSSVFQIMGKGIIEHTNFINKDNYDNNHIIYISNYMTDDNKLYDLPKEELLKEYMKYLTKINKEFTMENIKDYYVFDEKYAQPIIECNYSKSIIEAKLKNEKIYLCTMPQIYPEDRGMNYAIKFGNKVAKEIELYEK